MRTHDTPTLWLYACAPMCLAVLGGCSQMRVDSDYGPGIKLCGLGPNFAWRPGFEPSPSDPNAPYFEPREYLRHTIECGLEKRGFTLTTPETANFWIDYSFCRALQGDPYDLFIQYEEGILVLRFIDSSSRLLIWRGWAESRLDERAKPEDRRENICEAVDEILDRFPYKPHYYVGESVEGEIIIENSPVYPATVYPSTMPAPCCD